MRATYHDFTCKYSETSYFEFNIWYSEYTDYSEFSISRIFHMKTDVHFNRKQLLFFTGRHRSCVDAFFAVNPCKMLSKQMSSLWCMRPWRSSWSCGVNVRHSKGPNWSDTFKKSSSFQDENSPHFITPNPWWANITLCNTEITILVNIAQYSLTTL